MFHSLDVWHKSNKVTAKVSEVRKLYFWGVYYTFALFLASKKKGCKSLSEWAAPIMNHFRYSCRECAGDADRLRV